MKTPHAPETHDAVSHPEYFASPCLACRRRVMIAGQPVFTTCSCLNYGRSVTVAAFAAGVTVVAGGWLLHLLRK